RARVLDLDDHAALGAPEPDAQGATGLHRVEGVAEQIEEELLERRVVAQDLTRVWPGCPADRDPLLIETRLEQLDGVRDGRLQIERAVRASAGPGERPQPAGEVLHAPDLPPDDPGEFLPELLVQKLPRQQLGEGLDRHEGVLDLVTDARGEYLEVGEPLGATPFHLELLKRREIAQDGHR